MKSRRFSVAIALALLLSVVFGYGMSPLMRPGGAAPAAANNDSFKGKIVLAVLLDNHTVPLEHPQSRKLGDRAFLVGKGSDDGHPANWTKGRTTWVPMDRVGLIVEFESVEEMKKAWEEYRNNAPAGAPEQAGREGSP